jgi:hypothetical protein
MPPDSCQGKFLAEPFQINELQDVLHAPFLLRPVEAHDLQRQHDVLLDAPPRIKPRRLEHVAIGPVPPRLVGGHAVDGDLAARGMFQRRDDPQEGGLAAARGADEADEIALVDGQVHVTQRLHRAVGRLERQVETARLDHRRLRGRHALSECRLPSSR